jgi:hypothetical protein
MTAPLSQAGGPPSPNGTASHRRRKADGEACRETPPTARPINRDGIPAELLARRQWVVWRYDWREDKAGKGKWSKVLDVARQAAAGRDRKAKSDDGRTWDDFDRALDAYQRGGWAGIGYVFSPDDPYAGIDLDDCRDPDTGDLDPWAVDLLALLGGYAEVSPSGTGVKVIVKAQLPAGRRKTAYGTGEVEMYDRGRYFALTGEALADSPAEIPERQQQLEEAHRRVFPRKQRPAAALLWPSCTSGRCAVGSSATRVSACFWGRPPRKGVRSDGSSAKTTASPSAGTAAVRCAGRASWSALPAARRTSGAVAAGRTAAGRAGGRARPETAAAAALRATGRTPGKASAAAVAKCEQDAPNSGATKRRNSLENQQTP